MTGGGLEVTDRFMITVSKSVFFLGWGGLAVVQIRNTNFGKTNKLVSNSLDVFLNIDFHAFLCYFFCYFSFVIRIFTFIVII